MTKTSKSNYLDLNEMFRKAVEQANTLDVDEPLMVWPEAVKKPKPVPETKPTEEPKQRTGQK